MNRWAILIYGIVAYAMFLGIFLWSIAFTGNFLIPLTLDVEPDTPFGTALLVNLALLSMFAVQHSLMARPFFKTWITKYIPQAAERSTYVLASNIVMVVLLLFWQPMGPEIWNVSHPVFSTAIYALFFAGWAVLFLSTCMINHFDLFGVRQVWLNFRGEQYSEPKFQTPGFYKYVRHPLYVGWLMIFWSTPVMSLGHLLFTVGCTGYILIAIRWEERDLIDHLGVDYTRYRDEVPMLIPNFGATANESGVHTAHR